mgnify:FL=1
MSHIGNDAWYEQQQDTFLEDYGSLINVLQEYHQAMANQSDKTENELSFEVIRVACKLFPKWKKLLPTQILEKAIDFYEDYLDSGRFHDGEYKSKEGEEILPSYFEPRDV